MSIWLDGLSTSVAATPQSGGRRRILLGVGAPGAVELWAKKVAALGELVVTMRHARDKSIMRIEETESRRGNDEIGRKEGEFGGK